MKKNKTLLGVALLIAVLMLGVGYALESRQLSLTGTATANPTDANFIVEFSSATANNTSDTATFTGTSATYTVNSLTEVGQTAVETFKIKNMSKAGINANITAGQIAKTDDGNYFEVTSDLTGNTNVAINGEATYTVTVKLIKAPVDAAATGTFTVGFTAEAVAAAN